jgi:uncharacterized membrane protein
MIPPGGSARVDIGESLTWGWNKFKDNAGPLVIVMLAAFVGLLVGGLVLGLLRSAADNFFTWLLVSAVGQVALFVLGGFLQIGVYQSALAIADGRRVEPAKMFRTDMLGAFLIATLLTSLMVGIGVVLCILPGIVLAYLTYLTPFYVLDQRMAPVEAIRTSIQVTSSNLATLLPFSIVIFLVYLAGAIACCVGLLVSAPVALLAVTHAYRGISGRPVAV